MTPWYECPVCHKKWPPEAKRQGLVCEHSSEEERATNDVEPEDNKRKCEKCGVSLSDADFIPCDGPDCPLLASFQQVLARTLAAHQPSSCSCGQQDCPNGICSTAKK